MSPGSRLFVNLENSISSFSTTINWLSYTTPNIRSCVIWSQNGLATVYFADVLREEQKDASFP